MASPPGDGAEQPEATSPASPAAGDSSSAEPPVTAAPTGGQPASGSAPAEPGPAGPAEPAPIMVLPPPVAVPTVRVRPERSVKGVTTASDYVAPREMPTNTPQPAETAAAKVVIHVPDALKSEEAEHSFAAPSEAEVAELRKRRRAPTLKIDRAAVKELKALDDARIVAATAGASSRPSSRPGALATAGTSARTTAAPRVADTPRPLARARAEAPSSRRTGWIVALLATAIVGGGALAVGLGWVPGLKPADVVVDDRAVGDAPDARTAPGASSAEGPATDAPSGGAVDPASTGTQPAVDGSAAPVTSGAPSVGPGMSTSVAPSASGPPASSSSAAPPAPPPRAPAPWPPRPRPRPKSDIPSGI